MTKKRKKTSKYGLAGLFLIGGVLSLAMYSMILASNVKRDGFLYIPTGSSYKQVQDSLQKHDFLKNYASFESWQKIKKYQNYVKSGRYSLRKGMTNRQLVNILRSGQQTPVKLTFNNVRTLKQFVQIISTQIEADSAELMKVFLDNELLKEKQFSAFELNAIFIPNTYEFWWNTNALQFLERMLEEYHKFWNTQRIQKARNLNLSPMQVSIIASIVEEETKKNDEKPLIASVYINRLKKDMLLQADPTVKYAMGDFGLKRILNIHLSYDSPFNTYQYKGLPPGPICFPSTSSLEAVLDAPQSGYLYFCARPDFSGYHAFSKTYSEHLQNARQYWAIFKGASKNAKN